MRKALVAVGVTAALLLGAGAGASAVGAGASRDMHDRMATTEMPMGGMGMEGMAGMAGMDMGAMHAQMRSAMPAGMAEACDAAHLNGSPAPGQPPADHEAHHPKS